MLRNRSYIIAVTIFLLRNKLFDRPFRARIWESSNGGPVIKNSGTLTLCVEQEKLFQNFLFPKHEED